MSVSVHGTDIRGAVRACIKSGSIAGGRAAAASNR
jgi:hypothetical protein